MAQPKFYGIPPWPFVGPKSDSSLLREKSVLEQRCLNDLQSNMREPCWPVDCRLPVLVFHIGMGPGDKKQDRQKMVGYSANLP